MKSNNVKEGNVKTKPEANSLGTRAAEAKKEAEAARQRARVAKIKFKAARKAFKQARKVAKQARKQAKVLAKALKAQTRPAPKAAHKKRPRQSPPKLKPEQKRETAPRIIIEKPATPGALIRPAVPSEPETGRSQTPKIGT